MNIEINKDSEITIGDQLSQQIVFLIATGKLKPGDQLPSVREMARRFSIHANTVSEAYKNLVQRLWIKRHHGKRMVVRAPHEPLESHNADLDDLIDAMVRSASRRGYSMRDLRKRVRERLWVAQPDHVLIIEEDPSLRRLLHRELSDNLSAPVKAVSPKSLSGRQRISAKALAVSLPGRVWDLLPVLPRECTLVLLEPAPVDSFVEAVRKLKQPSVIGIVSTSFEFLRFARSLLAPALGTQHTMEERLIDEDATIDLHGLDLVFCDTIAHPLIKRPRAACYRLVSDSAIAELSERLTPPPHDTTS
jgi:GntR family transcriptional regulator